MGQNRNKITVSVLLLFFVFASCRKETREPSDLGLAYYPVAPGNWVAYNVIEIKHDNPVGIHDTMQYQLMEKIESTFIDNQGRPSVRIERYKRNTASDAWSISDIWYATQTNSGLERVEEDVRFLRMAYPIRENKEWDGNSLNTMDAWDYFYEDVEKARNINGLQFDKTTRVNQRENFNLVECQRSWEVYAENVGLISKYYKNLVITNFDSLNPVTGDELYLTVFAYGGN